MHRKDKNANFERQKCLSSKLQNIRSLKLARSYEALKIAIFIEMGKNFTF